MAGDTGVGDGSGADAEDVCARLALRALWPLRPAPGANGRASSKKAIAAGVHVIVVEDFMSDSGAADKVQLLCGQRGLVKKIIESGHASIDFEEHKKLQWVAKGNLHKLSVEGDDAGDVEDDTVQPSECSSLLRRQVLAQLNDAFDTGFQRRLERLEKKFELLQSGQLAPPSNGVTQQRPAATPAPAPAATASTKSLSKALAKALRTKPRVKVYGPTQRQVSLPDPPEKEEDILPESRTLKLTLQAVEQNVANRQRQLISLRDQVKAVEDICQAVRSKADAATASEKALQADPAMLQKTHEDGLLRQRVRVEELAGQLRKVEDQSRRFNTIFHDQRRYVLQQERISLIGGPSSLAKHAAGDVFLYPQPLPFDEEQPESWDVGTAIANPYNVDSWPFEPNVLARRTFQQEVPMDPFVEETQEDLLAEKLSFKNPFLPSLRLPRRDDSDDDDDYEDGYGGPSGTSRSL